MPSHLSDLVIHPYFGFAINNKTNSADDLVFGQALSPLESRRHKGKLRVVVLGGSVAVRLASLRKVGRLLRVRDEQASLLESAQSNMFGRSAILGLLFAHQVKANDVWASALVTEIEHQNLKGKLSFEAGGPSFDFDNENETYDYLAKLWGNSSTLLERLVSSQKASYIQFFSRISIWKDQKHYRR